MRFIFYKINNFGFTLTELKITIVIIVILASAIMWSFRNTRDDTRFARALAFEQKLLAALYAEQQRTSISAGLAGDFPFDDMTIDLGGGVLMQNSDERINLAGGDDDTFSLFSALGSEQFVSTDCISGNCLYVGGQNQGILYNLNDNIPVPDTSFTAMAWIKYLETSNAFADAIFLYQSGNGSMIRVANTGVLNHNISLDPSGSLTNSVGTLTADAWHHVAMIYNSEAGVYKSYLDGELIDEKAAVSNVKAETIGGLIIAPSLHGYIDSLKIFHNAPSDF